jgi:Mn-dependent DtxR family transcriptional regulator
MSKIVIGETAKHKVKIDLDILLSTRMLLTADSGGGKTFALKKIIEEANEKIQILVVDPEGEFPPLRENFNFVLVGKGGETPADVRSAALVAQTLLKLRASAICDIYEMKPTTRHEWVSAFLNGLIEAPKEHRHPCLVIVDEAHMFCPEKGKGESVATEAMRDLCTRGRKRLLCPLFATQRLATLNKDASSMLLNRMIGPTFEDLNRKRAAEILSITREDQREFFQQIQLLEPGNFFVLGRAISRDRELMHVGAIKSAHGQDALKYELSPPPAPEAIKDLLPKLSDLPKHAEEKARTEAEYKSQIRELKQQLTLAKQQRPVSAPAPASIDQGTIDRAVKASTTPLLRQIETIRKQVSHTFSALSRAAQPLSEIANISIPEVKAIAVVPQNPVISKPVPPVIKSNVKTADGNGDLGRGERTVLIAIAQFGEVEREQLTVLTGYKRSSRDEYIQRLSRKGYVEAHRTGAVKITDSGIAVLGDNFEPLPTGRELQEYYLGRLPEGERRIFEYLIENEGRAIDRDVLSDALGYKRSSRDVYLQRLAARGLVESASRGQVQLSPRVSA